MTSTPFPMLKLPHVALREIFRSNEPLDIIRLAQCSKRTKKVIQSSYRPNMAVKVAFSYNIFTGIQLYDMNGSGWSWKFEIHCLYRDVEQLPKGNVKHINKTVILSRRQLEETMELTDQLAEMFNRENQIGTLLFDHFDNDTFEVYEWVRKHQPRIRSITLKMNKRQNIFLAIFLENCNNTEHVNLMVTPEVDFKTDIYLNIKRLEIELSSWVKLHNLRNMSCERLLLKNGSLTNKDLNKFLEYWVEGEAMPNMEDFQLRCKNINHEEIIHGHYTERIDADLVKIRLGFTNYGDMKVLGGNIIRRYDGVQAMIPHFENTRTNIHDMFYMFIID